MRLVLASRSPQRRAILDQVGADFDVRPTDVDELGEGEPREVALENARRKALALGDVPGADVLGVDTLVALDGRIYGKPADEAAARATLTVLAGRTHEVISGLYVAPQGATAVVTTRVRMRPPDETRLAWYLAAGEWRGRAGGYAVQGRGAALVERIDGDYLNVVGLPLAALIDLLPGLIPADAPRPDVQERARRSSF